MTCVVCGAVFNPDRSGYDDCCSRSCEEERERREAVKAASDLDEFLAKNRRDREESWRTWMGDPTREVTVDDPDGPLTYGIWRDCDQGVIIVRKGRQYGPGCFQIALPTDVIKAANEVIG